MKNMKPKIRSSALLILVAILFIAATTFYYQEILFRAGSFLAPNELTSAEVIIIEGDNFVSRSAIMIAKDLLNSGKVKQMIIVVHDYPIKEQIFAFPENYIQLMHKEMSQLKIKDDQYRIIVTPNKHPITLNESKHVLDVLSKQGIHKALLLANGFHTRRSFLTYQYVALPQKITIIPMSYFTDYQLNQWWLTDSGFRDFVSESLKLIYYQGMGYIPLKLSYKEMSR